MALNQNASLVSSLLIFELYLHSLWCLYIAAYQAFAFEPEMSVALETHSLTQMRFAILLL